MSKINQIKRMMVIVNPISGTHSKEGIGALISKELRKSGYVVELRHTTAGGDAANWAAEASEKGYYGVVVCGGDGTVNEAARGLIGSRTALGIIPMGSGNGLARHLQVPINLKGALKVIGENRILDCDYGTANGKPFFCTFGVGYDAIVTEKFNKMPTRGLSQYIRTLLDEFPTYKGEEYKILVNGNVLTDKALLIAVCNASQYGNNAYIAPEASIKDGLLDVTIIHTGNAINRALAGLDVLVGLIGKTTKSTTIRTAEVTIIRKHKGPVHLDGEPDTMLERIDVECHPGRLRLFTTARKSHYRTFLSPKIPIISPIVLGTLDVMYKIGNLFTPKRK